MLAGRIYCSRALCNKLAEHKLKKLYVGNINYPIDQQSGLHQPDKGTNSFYCKLIQL